MKLERGYALADILTGVHEMVIRVEMESPVRRFLLKEMAEIEYRLAFGASEAVQTAALIATFTKARSLMSI